MSNVHLCLMGDTREHIVMYKKKNKKRPYEKHDSVGASRPDGFRHGALVMVMVKDFSQMKNEGV